MRAPQWLIAVLILVPLRPLAAQSADPAFSLSISAKPEIAAPGEELILSIVLTNKTPQQIFFQTDRYHPETNYTIHVTDPSGEAAGKTRAYRMATGDRTGKDAAAPPADPTRTIISIGSVGISGVAPGKTMEERTALNGLFDLTRPGRYTIHVEKKDDTSKAVVKSNVVTVRIGN